MTRSEAAMRRLELMAAALEEVVRLHREVMDELKRGGTGDDATGWEEDSSGDAGGRHTSST